MADRIKPDETTQSKRYWRPRLSEEITEEQFLKLQKLIPYGTRRKLMGKLIDSLIDLLECTDSDVVVALLLQGKIFLTFDLKEINSETI